VAGAAVGTYYALQPDPSSVDFNIHAR
jgi:hypothetical protein